MNTCEQVISNSGAAFGTSGVRGLVEDLDDLTCFAYTYAFLRHLKLRRGLAKGGGVWVGHDRRPSSPRIAEACMAAIRHAGFVPEFSGEIPTPALAFAAQCFSQPAIMITGSHIPFDRNGIKFYRVDGELMKDDEAPIINCNAPIPMENFQGDKLSVSHIRHEPSGLGVQLWRVRYLSAFPQLLSGMRIGHYQHSAAGRDLLAQILTELGAEVLPLGRSETFVPVDTEAVGDADKEQARKWQIEHQLDAIISTDGDGDRPLLADEKGNYFRGDILGILAAIGLNASSVVSPVSTTTVLEKCNEFARVYRTKIGSPHVISAMQREAYQNTAVVVGFEPNGGFLTASASYSPLTQGNIDPLPTRDAILPILATISLSKKMDTTLSGLRSILVERNTASDRLEDTPTEKSRKLISSISSDLKKAAPLSPTNREPVHVNETDGLRMTFKNEDIIHLRPSGNAPELRIYVESDSEAAANELLIFAKSAVEEAISAL